MDVSVIIVNYNNKQLILNCVNSIVQFTQDVEYEVIVSDNGSCDGSVEAIKKSFPWIKLIENGQNLGFGAANNRALIHAKGKYILYLNSDTVLLNNAIKLFFDYFETADNQDSLGGIGAYLIDGDGKDSYCGGTFCSYADLCRYQIKSIKYELKNTLKKIKGYNNPRNNKIKHTKGSQYNKPNIEYISGADLFIKNDQYACFDERFFLYYEDTDLELRLYNIGKRFELIQGPKIVHYERGSQSEEKHINLVPNCWLEYSSVLYSKKNLNTKALLLKMLILIRFCNPFAIKRTKHFLRKVVEA